MKPSLRCTNKHKRTRSLIIPRSLVVCVGVVVERPPMDVGYPSAIVEVNVDAQRTDHILEELEKDEEKGSLLPKQSIIKRKLLVVIIWLHKITYIIGAI